MTMTTRSPAGARHRAYGRSPDDRGRQLSAPVWADMLAGVAVTLQRWPIIGRRPELGVFERALCSGELAGLVIYGRAGVGKTRLADECRLQAAAAGHPTERVAGSRTTALVPLGAVAALLAGELGRPGPDGQADTVALFEQARRALHQRHGGRRLVTVADDVSLLDAPSLALVGYLAAQGTIFLIATVRTGEPVPDLVTGLWRDGRLERIDLGDLSRAHLDTLLHLALGGPMEAGAGREFWEVTRGNPLYVRELVLGGLESGALVERSGVWHLEDRLPSTSRLLDLVGQRIGQLSAEARSVVELLALCQPLELGYVEATTPVAVLESLERAGLVTIAVDDFEALGAMLLAAEAAAGAAEAFTRAGDRRAATAALRRPARYLRGTGRRLPDRRRRAARRARSRPGRQLRRLHPRGMDPRLQPCRRDHARRRGRGPAHRQLTAACFPTDGAVLRAPYSAPYSLIVIDVVQLQRDRNPG